MLREREKKKKELKEIEEERKRKNIWRMGTFILLWMLLEKKLLPVDGEP